MAVAHATEGAHSSHVRPRSLVTLVIVAAIAIGLYVYAWPYYQNSYHQGKGQLPQKVTINMPNPDGG
jgi:hypothetical protein